MYDMVSLFLVEVGVLLVEQFLVDDISHGLVLAADGRREVDGIAGKQRQVHEEVLPQLRLAKQVAVQEVLVLVLAYVAYQPGVQDFLVCTDDGPECSGLGTSTCPP